MNVLGLGIPAHSIATGARERSVIGGIETSASGNVILRVGRENVAHGGAWHQTEHVVLTPSEVNELQTALGVALDKASAEVRP